MSFGLTCRGIYTAIGIVGYGIGLFHGITISTFSTVVNIIAIRGCHGQIVSFVARTSHGAIAFSAITVVLVLGRAVLFESSFKRMSLILKFGIISIITILVTLMLTGAVILPCGISEWAVSSTCRKGCSTRVTGSFPITSGYITSRSRGVRTRPDCIQSDRCIVRIASTCAVGRTCRSTCRTPANKVISTTCRNNGRKCEGYTISFGLTGRRTRTAICIERNGKCLNGFLCVSTVIANRNNLSTGSGCGEIVRLIAYRSDCRCASSTIAVVLVLGCTILIILGSCAMRAILIGGIISIVAHLSSSVLCSRIIGVTSVVVGAVSSTRRGNRTTVGAFFFPITSCYPDSRGTAVIASPYCIKSNGGVVRVTTASGIGCTRGRT